MSVSSSFIKLFWLINTAALLCACATPSQVYWDNKVKKLCEKDGGVTVYEKVVVSKKDYPNLVDSSGVFMIPSETHKKPNDQFYFSYKNEILINESPKVWKDEMLLVRNSDNKILGKQISYSRRGGDVTTGISEESYYGCTDINNVNLTESVFYIKGE